MSNVDECYYIRCRYIPHEMHGRDKKSAGTKDICRMSRKSLYTMYIFRVGSVAEDKLYVKHTQLIKRVHILQ